MNKFFVKENEGGGGIFINILSFIIESSKLINYYSTDMC
jgi:hypothetical protein